MVIAVLFMLAISCGGIKQKVSVGSDSNPEDCKLLYHVSTYYWNWTETEIIYSTYKYNVAKKDLPQVTREEYDKVLALSECKGFFDKE